MSKTLIVDLNNLAWVIRFGVLKTPKSTRKKDPNAMQHILFSMIDTTAKYAKKLQCTDILIACDSKGPWRAKLYPDYKATSTTRDDLYKNETLAAADEFRAIMENHTAAMVLAVPNCEADDIIGYWCQHKSYEDEVVILSTDMDFVQLLSDTVSIYSIGKKEFVSTQDPKFDLFLKCIRGDKNDNIPSAYPRVRQTKLEEAWNDDMKLLNLLETVLNDGSKVGDQLDKNMALIDLSQIPDWVVARIGEFVAKADSGKYSGIDFMSALSGHGLKSKADTLEGREKAFKKSPKISA